MWTADGRCRLVLATACLALAAAGCARTPAPSGAVLRPAQAVADPYGAWVHVERHGQAGPVAGELLAVDRDTVFVLTGEGAVRGIPVDSVREATIAWYRHQAGDLALWTMVGTLSTISNGWFLILTAPTWLITGSAATAAETRAPLVRVPARTDWMTARMYARYPAGLPPDLPRQLPPR
jgi:hypothetical protein